jgi:hypothetical protein
VGPCTRSVEAVIRASVALAAALLLAGCGGADEAAAPQPRPAPAPTGAGPADQPFPDVVDAVPTQVDGDVWSLEVTLHAPYGSPGRHADGWRVLAPDGTVLGEQALPAEVSGQETVTATQPHVRIPPGTGEVTVEGRDSVNGYGGEAVTVPVG